MSQPRRFVDEIHRMPAIIALGWPIERGGPTEWMWDRFRCIVPCVDQRGL